jgi:hypothetical protein
MMCPVHVPSLPLTNSKTDNAARWRVEIIKGRNMPEKNGRGRYIRGHFAMVLFFISQICMEANIGQFILLLMLNGKYFFID